MLVKYGMRGCCFVNLLQAVDDKYAKMNAISGPKVDMTFEEGEITLDIGEEESGWMSTPCANPVVSLYYYMLLH